MSEIYVVTSGKGGVGKTTTTANLGMGLAMRGKKVVLVDTDTGLRNLDLCGIIERHRTKYFDSLRVCDRSAAITIRHRDRIHYNERFHGRC